MMGERQKSGVGDRVPPFLRIVDADPQWRRYLFGPAASRDANGNDVLVLALIADDHSCAPAKFQRIGAVYDLNRER